MDYCNANSRTGASGWVLWVAACCALVSLHCFEKPLEPVPPSWDSRLTIPLANRSYSLLDIVVRDTTMLRPGEGGQILYAASASTPPTVLGDLLSIHPPDTMLSVRFGVFAVTAPTVLMPVQIPWMPPGATVPIPDTTFAVPDVTELIPTFQQITFAQGTMTLTLQNNLPVPLDVTGPVLLRDDQDRIVATFVFSPASIPPFSTRSASDNLSGRTISNELRIRDLQFHTPGSQTPVQIPAGDLIVATLATSGLRASSAVLAQIPPQNLVNNDSSSLPLDDSTFVKEASFRSGQIELRFASRVSLAMILRFRFKELYRRIGASYVPFVDSIMIPPGGTNTFTLNFQNLKIQSLPGDLLRSLEVVSSIGLPGGSGSPTTVSDTDKVEISVRTIVPVVMDSADLVLKPTWVDVTSPVPLRFGDLPTRFSGQLTIPAADLDLLTNISMGFPVDLYFTIAARRSSGEWVYLQVPASQKRITPGSGAVSFNDPEVGVFLSQLSGRLPDTLFISGGVIINPLGVYNPSPAGVGSVGRNSSFGGTVNLSVPLTLGITNGSYSDTLVLGDTTGDGRTDYPVDRKRLGGVNSGKVYIEVRNAMPLQIGVRLHLLDRSKQDLLELPRQGSPVLIQAAQVDGSGNVIVPANGSSVIELNEADVRQFDLADFVSYSVSLNTTPGSSAVRFRTSDAINIRIWSTFSYRVN